MEGKRVGSYQLCEKLITGGFSDVYLASHVETKKRAVVKLIHRSWYKNTAFVDGELLAVRELQHKSIIKTLHIEEIKDSNDVVLIMKFAKNGDLLEFCNDHELSEHQARMVFKKLAKALIYMHSKGFVHRDLKPENVLLRGSRVYLTDFGFATRYTPGEKSIKQFVGTRRYSSPEVLALTPYEGPATDVWGLGLVLYYMLSRMVPYDDAADMKEAQKRPLYLPPAVSNSARDLLHRMLKMNPDERLTLREVLQHPWVINTLTTLPGCLQKSISAPNPTTPASYERLPLLHSSSPAASSAPLTSAGLACSLWN